MLDALFWHGTTMLLWGAYWGCLCLLLCIKCLRQAPHQLGIAALVCALRYGSIVSTPLCFWAAAQLGFQPFAEWAAVFSYPVLPLLLMAVVVYGLRWVTPTEVGLRGVRPGSGRLAVLVVAAVAVAVTLHAYFTQQNLPKLWWSQRLFLAVLPGLTEELFYRGVLLGLLGRVFARRWPLPGARTSWGGGVGVILFALAHAWKLPAYQMGLMSATNLHVSLQGWYYWLPLWHSSAADQLHYLAMGALFLWVRERTGSVWAAVGTHCLMNASLLLGSSLSS